MKHKNGKKLSTWMASVLTAAIVVSTGWSVSTAPVMIAQAAQSTSASQTTKQDNPMILAINATKKAEVTLDSKTVSYKSSNPKIASVTQKGVVTGVSKGSAVITATTKTQSVKIPVTVYEQRLSTKETNISIEQDTVIKVTLARRYASEELLVSVADPSILGVTIGSWTKTTCPLTLVPKKNGTTTITINRPKSVEPLVVTVTVTLKEELSATQIYALCEQSMVEFTVTTLDGGNVTGSGFFVGEGLVLTNYHVVSGAKEIKITDYDGKEYKVTGYYGYLTDIDLALFSVKGTKKALKLALEGEQVGDVVYTIGSPYGFTGTFSKGIISHLKRQVEDYCVKYIQHTAAISKGNSGGPLINRYGEVIGINTLTYSAGQNLNFSIPISYYMILTEQELKPISQFFDEMTKAD